MSTPKTLQFAVTCPTCGTREELDDPNEAVEMHRRHAGVTGHTIEWERTDLDVDVPAGGVEAVLRALCDRYEEGVPVGIVTAAMSERGVGIDETLDELYELRMAGQLYEPRDDHLLHI